MFLSRKSRPRLFFLCWEVLPGPSLRTGPARESPGKRRIRCTLRVWKKPFVRWWNPCLKGWGIRSWSSPLAGSQARLASTSSSTENKAWEWIECAEISGMLFPRLETIDALADPSLEVSSPGMDRVVKRPSEYDIFRGRGVRVLAGACNGVGVRDHRPGGGGDAVAEKGKREHGGSRFPEIRKARLDHSVEVEEAKNAV